MDAPLGHDASNRFQKIDKAVLLAQCPLFAGLSSWELRAISQLMRLVEYKKDEVVYREGGEADSFYVIVSGRFEAFVSHSEKKKVLAYLRRGDYFGEMSLLTGQPHSATLRALSDSLVLEIRKEGFKKSIEQNATLSLELSRRLSSRLKVSESRSRSLFRSDVAVVYGALPKSVRGVFSYNLAASLVAETHQRTVLVDLAASEDEPPVVGQRISRMSARSLTNVETFSEQEMLGRLTRHRAGFDMICLKMDASEAESEAVLISLLNHLAIDFRFIVVDVESEFGPVSAKAVSQADISFLVTDSHMNSLTETREIAQDIERTLAFPSDKIAIVIQEAAFGAHTHSALRQELFGKRRCFALPPPPDEPQDASLPVADSMPDSDYSRAVRHMARFLGGNLVGLALGSGAALGLAHIGVLKVLERERIPIDIIAGSSIGALIGSLYAVGSGASEIEKAAMEIDLRLLASRLVDINLFPIRGLMHGQQVIKHFRKHLGNKSFDQCRIPLRVTGADLTTRESILYESGLVADAVRASIAIPAIIRPVIREDRHVIVDGGILNPLPVRALHEAGASKVIAVNVFPSTKDMIERRLIQEEAIEKERSLARQKGFLAQLSLWLRRSLWKGLSPNLFDILMNTIQAMESEIAAVEAESADIVLRPVLASANWVDFFKPGPLIKRGEEETERFLTRIRSLVSQQTV